MMAGRSPSPRRGYSLTLVVIYLFLLFALWGTVYHATSSLLRIETERLNRKARDEGAMQALARAVRLLEFGRPPGSKTYGVMASGVPFTVRYDPAPDKGPNVWRVRAYSGAYGTPLPPYPANPGDAPAW
jgi:hypothetical protein